MRTSYAVPFLLVGVVYYFVGSLQGTFEALRSLNLLWHFNNYTVGHSHITMYGFVTFLIWGSAYGLLPRLSGREAPQLAIGMHFWLAFVGIFIYGVALSIGGTLQGLSWKAGQAFVESVTLMAPYWIWRSVGGTLMVASHLLFAFNLLRMLPARAAAPVVKGMPHAA